MCKRYDTTQKKKGQNPQRNSTQRDASQDRGFSPIALMRLARAMKPMELDSREEAILQGDIVLQAYFVIKGRIEAYVHEEQVGDRASWVGGDVDGPPLRQFSYLGVWGPGSLWGLSNIMLGGFSEVRMVFCFCFGRVEGTCRYNGLFHVKG